jgi:hypothetical protein
VRACHESACVRQDMIYYGLLHILSQKYLIESVPESWVTPMEPGKFDFDGELTHARTHLSLYTLIRIGCQCLEMRVMCDGY